MLEQIANFPYWAWIIIGFEIIFFAVYIPIAYIKLSRIYAIERKWQEEEAARLKRQAEALSSAQAEAQQKDKATVEQEDSFDELRTVNALDPISKKTAQARDSIPESKGIKYRGPKVVSALAPISTKTAKPKRLASTNQQSASVAQ